MGICPKYQKILEICPKNLKNPLKNPDCFRKKSGFLRFLGQISKIFWFWRQIPKIFGNFPKKTQKSQKKIPKKKFDRRYFFFRRILSPDFWYFFTMNLKIRLNPKSYELVISVLWQLSYGTWTVLREPQGQSRSPRRAQAVPGVRGRVRV